MKTQEKINMVQNIATLTTRVLGGFIDSVIIFVFSLLYVVILGEKFTDGTHQITGFELILLLLIIYSYFVILEATTGKTIGKYVARIRVVDEDGKNIGWKKSVIRNFIRIIDFFILYLIAFFSILLSKQNQRLGDLVAKTYVINT